MENLEIVSKIRIYDLNECGEVELKLIRTAREATQTAYAPYSLYHVGAAVLLEDGTIVCGNNQENAAYPSGICAERTALFYANAKYPNLKVKMVAIAAHTNGSFSSDICAPCGSCRQVFLEIENRYNNPIKILMTSQDKVYEIDSIRTILPLGFGKESLS